MPTSPTRPSNVLPRQRRLPALLAALGLLLVAAACGDTDDARGDAGGSQSADAGHDAGGDASSAQCPAESARTGACVEGSSCPVSFHGDCSPPSCAPGCTPRGGSSGIFYSDECKDGAWVRQSHGSCPPVGPEGCDCPDAGDESDAGR